MSAIKAQEVIILGGGVFGFSIAYHLAKEGIPSQVIEMDSIGAKASGKSDATIGDVDCLLLYGVSYGDSSYSVGGAKQFIPLMRESYPRFQQLSLELKERAGLDIQYASWPYLRCALSEKEEKTLTHLISKAKSEGLEIKWMSGDEARTLESALSTEVRGAALLDGGQVEPYRFTLALAQGAENLGATGYSHGSLEWTSSFLAGTEATGECSPGPDPQTAGTPASQVST